MAWLKRHLTHEDRGKIEEALRAADRSTSGEIVPVIVRSSAPYGHVFWLATALCLVGAGTLPLGRVPGGLRTAASVALCAALGWLLTRTAFVRRLLTPRKDRIHAVHRAAEAAFYRLALHRARGDAGVLLFVSLEEREAVVLAGAGIGDLAGSEHWRETCTLLTDSAARRNLGNGIERAIAHASLVLAKHHPAVPGETKVVLEQRLRILHETY